jgi:hypothetical protein
VVVLPCPDFEGFLVANVLRTHNISFICNLPDYVLMLGHQILEDNAFSNSNGCPCLSWLPQSPLVTSPSLSSKGPTPSVSRRTNVTIQAQHPPTPYQVSSCPDPDGIEAPTPPIFFAMGGHGSVGNFTPLTTSDIYSIRGGPPQRGYILTQWGLLASILPSSRTSILSSIAGSMVPTSSVSSESVVAVTVAPAPVISSLSDAQTPDTVPAPTSAPVPIPVSIKDEPSNMGIKPITDKDSWTDAKKIINAHLRRAPYWPGKSKELVTTDANAAARVWWEEVITYYCKPPVSDLFVDEHRFDGKGFEMIAHIDQHFNPSGAVDSLGYIFDLIDIKQSDQESVVTLKARFSKAFSALKMGGIGIDSPLQVGFMLRALLSRYHAVVQEFHLGRHSLTDASLQTVVEQCTNYDKDPWKGPVGKYG